MNKILDFDNLDRPVILQFYAEWCAPCKTLSKIVNHLRQEIELYADFVAVDIERDRELKDEFFVRSVPTLILLNQKGQIYWRHTGLVSAQDLVKHLRAVDRKE